MIDWLTKLIFGTADPYGFGVLRRRAKEDAAKARRDYLRVRLGIDNETTQKKIQFYKDVAEYTKRRPGW